MTTGHTAGEGSGLIGELQHEAIEDDMLPEGQEDLRLGRCGDGDAGRSQDGASLILEEEEVSVASLSGCGGEVDYGDDACSHGGTAEEQRGPGGGFGEGGYVSARGGRGGGARAGGHGGGEREGRGEGRRGEDRCARASATRGLEPGACWGRAGWAPGGEAPAPWEGCMVCRRAIERPGGVGT